LIGENTIVPPLHLLLWTLGPANLQGVIRHAHRPDQGSFWTTCSLIAPAAQLDCIAC